MTQSSQSTIVNQQSPKLVPLGITIGLGLFALCLSLAGFVLMWLFGRPLSAVIMHALKVVPLFMLGIPCLICLGAKLMNHWQQSNIAMLNAWTLGWLLSCVAMLSIMGVYS